MNNADSPKPPLAPKPRTSGHFTPVAISKFPPSPRSDILHSPNSMSRGPKPPIAPKPKLAATNRGKARVYMNNTFNKCSNGKLICSDGELYEGNQSNPECSESEADDEYILVTETLLTKGDYRVLEQEHACCAENEKLTSLAATREEETEAEDPCSSNCSSSFEAKVEETEEDSLTSTDRGDDSNELPQGGDSERTDPGGTETQDPVYENTGEDTDCENDAGDKDKLLMSKEGDSLIENQNGYSLERERICSGSEDYKDIILTHMASDEPEASGEQPGEPEESLDVGDANTEKGADAEPSLSDHYDASDIPPARGEAEGGEAETETECNEGLAPCNELNETDSAVEDPEITDWENKDNVHKGDRDAEAKDDQEEEEEEVAVQGVGEDAQDAGDTLKDETADESCQIVPFESEGGDELLDSLPENSFAFLPTESTSFCSGSCYPLSESMKDSESGMEVDLGATSMGFLVTGSRTESTLKENHETRGEADDVSGDGTTLPEQTQDDEQAPVTELVNNQSGSPEDGAFEVPAVVVVPEETLDDETVDDSLIDPYVMGVSLIHRDESIFPGGRGYSETKGEESAQSNCSTKEEINGDADNGLIAMDRKNIVTRARSHSGKVPGYVPETVPEETGPETDLLAVDSRHSGQEGNKTWLPMEGKPLEINRALPAKPRSFILYPRSFSVEGRDLPISLYRELEESMLDDGRIKRKEDNLSLPGVIGSSGSFSQRSHLSSSGMSTPSSLVDIPPPFDLACITKKPITKSSPSLLIDNDSPDKYTKKKKSSFKRFLALTFKKRTENKVHVDVNVSSSRSSSESSYHGPSRVLEIDRRSLSNSPQLKSRSGKLRASESPSSIIFYRDMKRKGAAFSRSVSRVESFEDRSRPPFLPLPLTKPRSISFPNADTSDYENIPAMNSDYENIQIPPRRPTRAGTFTKLFEDPSRALSTANENDGYVDMSSFNAFESKQQTTDQETESAYTEPYKVCPISAVATEDVSSDEEQKSSEEEESSQREPGLTHKKEGQSRAYVIAQELLSSEKSYGQVLQHLMLDFHEAILKALSEETEDNEESLARGELRQGLSELPAIYELHQEILSELEERILNWEEQPKVADIFLTRAPKFDHHVAYIVKFDKNLTLLNGNYIKSSQLAATIREFESPQSGGQGVKHQLLKVIEHIFQYQVLLTDYLNNLCPDSAEYENTQDALALISKVTDRANDSMEQGENLQKLVHIEHSVRGQNNLLQPGREFLKEGTLMKVTGKSRHPRHLFLMSDVLLYTFPQKDGKYRLKNTLAVSSMRVSRPVMEKVPYALKIESAESCLMLSASSCSERDEWYSCLSRALPEDYKMHTLAAFHNSVEIRERLGICLGERPPTLVPVSHVMMCMNCGCDFSLTLRRHHCHACGKIVCRNCSRNKYPLKYLKDRLAKVCDGCYAELKKRGGDVPVLLKERPVSMSFPMSSSRFSSGAFSSVFHSINPSAFKKQKKIPSALTEVAASGEGSAISGYLSRRKKGKRHWKTLWFVVKGKVLYTYMASEDKVATESIPLLGFTIALEEGNRELGLVFHLYHKQTLFYSFRAEDANSAQRWVEAMRDATVL
ncbi:FYVE, RhoGEF and PH domain-containing protein 5 isoform X3 [Dromiciops gliroides]|uniref:FYVE, RhoGEF and PH domain-containing protein 5 isoform X3 n=1 Tax=Dromiciops gliroides TaxID=33562 RepID=UPI001CC5F160|nr:FYVE, RhoGEF and PH domain-containing protein 5 isoform X3 [Dromiciops gliroides]